MRRRFHEIWIQAEQDSFQRLYFFIQSVSLEYYFLLFFSVLFHQIKSLAKVPNKYVPQKENLKHGLNLSKIQAELFNPATNLGVSHKNELHYMFHINNITPLFVWFENE